MSDGSFRAFVLEQLKGLGVVLCKPMFGGYGLTHDKRFFGIVHKDRLYFKVSEATKGAYLQAGSEVFVPNKGRNLVSFYEVPADIVESPKRTVEWARAAVKAAGIKEEIEPDNDRIVRHPDY